MLSSLCVKIRLTNFIIRGLSLTLTLYQFMKRFDSLFSKLFEVLSVTYQILPVFWSEVEDKIVLFYL